MGFRISPVSKPVVCPECNQNVKYGRKRGRLYSHNLEGSTEVCPASGRAMGDVEETIVESPTLIKPKMNRVINPIDPNYSESVSVKAISAGLPGSKRR